MSDIVGIDRSLRVPGRLCADPTAIGTFPHGGKDLGEARRISFFPGQAPSRPIIGEEYGGEPLDYIVRHQAPYMMCLMRGFPSNMMELAFPAGAGSGSSSTVSYPGAAAADQGYLGSTRAVKLLFSPQDTTNHLAVVLYEAVPLFEESTQMQMMVTEELGLAVVFRALRTAAGKVCEIGRLGSISL